MISKFIACLTPLTNLMLPIDYSCPNAPKPQFAPDLD
uniref:Uncharacterized protein n=1 Tax=Arundo donax TaxID=35708 RepID=A0A0A8ZIM4_ARUDO